MPIGPLAVTTQSIESEALNGRYYNYQSRAWESTSLIEWLYRKVLGTLLCGVVDNLGKACQRRSWHSVEFMPEIPAEIKNKTLTLLLDSRFRTHPISAYGQSISRIFCKIERDAAKGQGRCPNELHILPSHRSKRTFAILHGTMLSYLVGSSDYGQLDFYRGHQKQISNSFDSLYDNGGKRIAAIKLGVDYPRLPASMEVYSGSDQPLMLVDDLSELTSLIFREAGTHRLLAVANKTQHGKVNWTATILDDKWTDEQSRLLTWAILKYSQHYHFPESEGYVSGPPTF